MDGSLWRKHIIGEAWLLGIPQKRRPLRKMIDNRTSNKRSRKYVKRRIKTPSIRCCKATWKAGQTEAMCSITRQLSWVWVGMAGIICPLPIYSDTNKITWALFLKTPSCWLPVAVIEPSHFYCIFLRLLWQACRMIIFGHYRKDNILWIKMVAMEVLQFDSDEKWL